MHDFTTLITLFLGLVALSIGLVLARLMRHRNDAQRKEYLEVTEKGQRLLSELLDAVRESNVLLKKKIALSGSHRKDKRDESRHSTIDPADTEK